MKILKKMVIACALISAMVLASLVSAPLPGSDIRVFINNNPVSFNSELGYPTSQDGRTLVPVRVISENMGYDVTWNDKERKVGVSNDEKSLSLIIGSDVARANGAAIKMEVPAQIIGSRTYVPLRFISEVMGAKVTWDGKNRIVFISMDGEVPVPVPVPIPVPGDGVPLKDSGITNTAKGVDGTVGSNPVVHFTNLPVSLPDGKVLGFAFGTDYKGNKTQDIFVKIQDKQSYAQVVLMKGNKILGGITPIYDAKLPNGNLGSFAVSSGLIEPLKEADRIMLYEIGSNDLYVVPFNYQELEYLPYIAPTGY